MVRIYKIMSLVTLFFSAPCHATSYVFSITAQVSDLRTSETLYTEDCCDMFELPTQSTSVHVGDMLALSFSFNPTSAVREGPVSDYYDFAVADLSIDLGSYHGRFLPGGSATVGVFNDEGNPMSPVDGFYVGVGQILVPGSSPFVLDNRPIAAGFSFSGYDYSAKARSTSDINEEPPLSAYPSQAAYLSFSSSDYQKTLSTDVGLDNLTAVLTPVPEPETWIMMICGIGLIGGAMRRRRHLSTSILKKRAPEAANVRSWPQARRFES